MTGSGRKLAPAPCKPKLASTGQEHALELQWIVMMHKISQEEERQISKRPPNSYNIDHVPVVRTTNQASSHRPVVCTTNQALEHTKHLSLKVAIDGPRFSLWRESSAECRPSRPLKENTIFSQLFGESPTNEMKVIGQINYFRDVQFVLLWQSSDEYPTNPHYFISADIKFQKCTIDQSLA